MNLGEVEKRILEVAGQSPGGRRLTVDELAMECDVDEEVIHQKLQDEGFRGMFLEAARNSLVADVPEVLNAFVEQAKMGNFNHGKLLLQLVGMHTDTKNIVADVGMSEQEGKSAWKTEEEKKQFMRETLKGLIEEDDTDG